MTWRTETEQSHVLSGRSLRFLVLDEIRSRRSMTVAEMAVFVAESGFAIRGRPSKVISDSLRWEVARGRVKRVRRGVYVYGRPPTSTARRVRMFARRCHDWMDSIARGERPQPVPPVDLDRQPGVIQYPEQPPWANLYWLWSR